MFLPGAEVVRDGESARMIEGDDLFKPSNAVGDRDGDELDQVVDPEDDRVREG